MVLKSFSMLVRACSSCGPENFHASWKSPSLLTVNLATDLFLSISAWLVRRELSICDFAFTSLGLAWRSLMPWKRGALFHVRFGRLSGAMFSGTHDKSSRNLALQSFMFTDPLNSIHSALQPEQHPNSSDNLLRRLSRWTMSHPL